MATSARKKREAAALAAREAKKTARAAKQAQREAERKAREEARQAARKAQQEAIGAAAAEKAEREALLEQAYTVLAYKVRAWENKKEKMRKSLADGTCAYLTADNLCRINPVKPDKCRTFPFEWTNPDSNAVCPEMNLALRQDVP